MNIPILDEGLLTMQEAAELSKMSVDTIRDACSSRELSVVIFGPKSWRIAPSDLRRWWSSKQRRTIPVKNFVDQGNHLSVARIADALNAFTPDELYFNFGLNRVGLTECSPSEYIANTKRMAKEVFHLQTREDFITFWGEKHGSEQAALCLGE
jgi:excisionase family DNA binding protein